MFTSSSPTFPRLSHALPRLSSTTCFAAMNQDERGNVRLAGEVLHAVRCSCSVECFPSSDCLFREAPCLGGVKMATLRRRVWRSLLQVMNEKSSAVMKEISLCRPGRVREWRRLYEGGGGVLSRL